MPTKRAVLADLTRTELRAGLDHYELAVDDHRVKAQLVDALARSRKARLDEMLLRLSRNRLKELCRVFGLDDSGRKKADLVAHLVGPAAASSGPESPNVASGDDDAGSVSPGEVRSRITLSRIVRKQVPVPYRLPRYSSSIRCRRPDKSRTGTTLMRVSTRWAPLVAQTSNRCSRDNSRTM